MKKVFISVPVEGRKYNDIISSIKKMKDIARVLIEEEVSFVMPEILKLIESGEKINSYFSPTSDPLEEKVVNLDNKKLMKMMSEWILQISECDYVVGLDHLYEFREVEFINDIPRRFGLQLIVIDWNYICPDIREIFESKYIKCNELMECALEDAKI